MSQPVPSARDRARAAMIEDVIAVARRQLGRVGAAGLSVRSVTRELGISASAVYRYFSSRDHLLTALIVDAYERLGAFVIAADEAVPVEDVTRRWVTVWLAARDWGVAHPHEYALLYGTPVLGYAAPQDTVLPATRVVARLGAIVADAHRLGLRTDPPEAADPPGAGLREDADRIRASLPRLGLDPAEVSAEDAIDVVRAWSELFGAISFELFGHFVGSIDHPAENLEALARARAAVLGLPGLPGAAASAGTVTV
ncbi:TetR/AcrR family transcriptional regulator [Pseudactinotalea sp. HY158]|uniref:TetR/AcrR family transcriptional regulator n=1 Tax=Pseudactinotalea sp. HY158 TaxID=2654547 RepID=UPI00129C4CD3|nr:TetR/AcrR family transcriptional regulator [Pseudactinotalea sp. HY158]QGH68280.1 TetR family transcriptional regulator [Pseudactinotalea sp. HY158]